MKEINNITIYTREIIKDFFEVYFFDKIKNIRIIINIMILILITSYFVKGTYSLIDNITLIASLFAFIELNTKIIPIINYNKTIKNNNKTSIIGTTIKYIFREDSYCLNKKDITKYKDLVKVIETDKAYYLYEEKNKALIVDKTLLNKEDIKTLTSKFKVLVPKYIYK